MLVVLSAATPKITAPLVVLVAKGNLSAPNVPEVISPAPISGISAATKALKDGAPLALEGAAYTVFLVCEPKVAPLIGITSSVLPTPSCAQVIVAYQFQSLLYQIVYSLLHDFHHVDNYPLYS